MPSDPQSNISIVIPVYNGAEYLERAIASALAQTTPPAEIAITDDASTDATESIMRKFENHPLVKVQRLPERVIAPIAWNEAIRYSTAPYFIILAHDDLLHPTFIAETQTVLSNHPEIGFIVSGYRVIDETGQVTSERPITQPRLIGKTRFEDLFDELVTGGGMYFSDTGSVVVRSAFDQVGGFDERFKGGVYDWDFYLRLAAVTQSFGLAPCLADYRIHASNMSADLHRDDKGDGDVVFSKLSEYSGFSAEQKKQLVQNISNFQFQHYTRALRSSQLKTSDVRKARDLVAGRLNRWATSPTPYAQYVLQKPRRLSARVAWSIGALPLGDRCLHMAVKMMLGSKSRWS